MLKAHKHRCNCTAFCRISYHFVTPKGMTSGKHYLFCFNLGTISMLLSLRYACRGLWKSKSEAPIWMAAIVICLGAIVIYLSTSRPSHRLWSHGFTSSTESKFHSASPHTMPFTPAHLQSFLDAVSVGHSCSNRSIQILFAKRLRLTCDGRCSVDSRVHLLNEQADAGITQIFVSLLMSFLVQLVDFTHKEISPLNRGSLNATSRTLLESRLAVPISLEAQPGACRNHGRQWNSSNVRNVFQTWRAKMQK